MGCVFWFKESGVFSSLKKALWVAIFGVLKE
jgi:hypothetical protein